MENICNYFRTEIPSFIFGNLNDNRRRDKSYSSLSLVQYARSHFLNLCYKFLSPVIKDLTLAKVCFPM